MQISNRTKIIVPLFLLSIIPTILVYFHFTQHISLPSTIDLMKSFVWMRELLLVVIVGVGTGLIWAFIKRDKVLVPIFVIVLIAYCLMYMYFIHGLSLYTAIGILRIQIVKLGLIFKVKIIALIAVTKKYWAQFIFFLGNLTRKKVLTFIALSTRKSIAIKFKQILGLVFFTYVVKKKTWFKTTSEAVTLRLKKVLFFFVALHSALHISLKIGIAFAVLYVSYSLFSVDGIFAYLPKGTFKWVGTLFTKFIEKFSLRTTLDTISTFLMPGFIKKPLVKIRDKFLVKNVIKVDEVATVKIVEATAATRKTISNIAQSKIVKGGTRQISNATSMVTNNIIVKTGTKLTSNGVSMVAGGINTGIDKINRIAKNKAERKKRLEERETRNKAKIRKSTARKTRKSRSPEQLRRRHLRMIKKQSRRNNR